MGILVGWGLNAVSLLLLAWIVLRFVLDVPGRFAPAALALGVGGSVALALAVGVLATFRLLGEKPLPVLRRE